MTHLLNPQHDLWKDIFDYEHNLFISRHLEWFQRSPLIYERYEESAALDRFVKSSETLYDSRNIAREELKLLLA